MIYGILPTVIVAVVLLGTGCATTQTTPATGPAWRMQAPDWPTPPMQDEPWTEAQSERLIPWRAAVDATFAAGVPDPRGCEYRHVSFALHDGWGSRIIDTTGWVLPATDPDAPRWAIGWDGMLHQVVTLGPPATLPDPAILKVCVGKFSGHGCVPRVEAELTIPELTAEEVAELGRGMESIYRWPDEEAQEDEETDENGWVVLEYTDDVELEEVAVTEISIAVFEANWLHFALIWRSGDVELAEAYALRIKPDENAGARLYNTALLVEGIRAHCSLDTNYARACLSRLLVVAETAEREGTTDWIWSPRPSAAFLRDLLAEAGTLRDQLQEPGTRWVYSALMAESKDTTLTAAAVRAKIPEADARADAYVDLAGIVPRDRAYRVAALMAAEGPAITPRLLTVLRNDRRIGRGITMYHYHIEAIGPAWIVGQALSQIYNVRQPDNIEAQLGLYYTPESRVDQLNFWSTYIAANPIPVPVQEKPKQPPTDLGDGGGWGF